jgi:hypothetical protein
MHTLRVAMPEENFCIVECCCLGAEYDNTHVHERGKTAQERGKLPTVVAFYCLMGPTRCLPIAACLHQC